MTISNFPQIIYIFLFCSFFKRHVRISNLFAFNTLLTRAAINSLGSLGIFLYFFLFILVSVVIVFVFFVTISKFIVVYSFCPFVALSKYIYEVPVSGFEEVIFIISLSSLKIFLIYFILDFTGKKLIIIL